MFLLHQSELHGRVEMRKSLLKKTGINPGLKFDKWHVGDFMVNWNKTKKTNQSRKTV